MAKKNLAAQAMARKRWSKTTKAERKAYAQKIVGVRWAKYKARKAEGPANPPGDAS